MLPGLHGHVTLAYLAAGELARATSAADEAGALAARARAPVPACHQAWSLATIALYGGDGERAHRLVAGAWGSLRRPGALRLEAIAGDLRALRARCALAAAAAHTGRTRARWLRDADAQARWLRASTLASGPAIAGAIAARQVVLAGRGNGREQASAASAALRRVGLVLESDALARWSTGQAPRPIDRMYVA